MKNKVVTLILTDEQHGQLADLQNRVLRAYADGSKGALVGQVFPESGEIKVFFLSNTQARQMYKLINKKEFDPEDA